jgi:hypothetical protein
MTKITSTKYFYVLCLLLLVLITGCKKNPTAPKVEETWQTIDFSGYKWDVKSSSEDTTGPGGNYFSNRKRDVWVDADSQLHLKITKRNGKWYCTEVVSQKSFGYGKYIFYLGTWLDSLTIDKNVVLGLFTYDSLTPGPNFREIDIEFSKWAQEVNQNAQFLVQPYQQSENVHRFDVKLNGYYSTHSFDWRSDSIFFQSLHGHYASPPNNNYIIETWRYGGDDNPTPGNEKVRINLWLFRHQPPTDDKDVEVIIKRFEFIPLPQDTSLIDNSIVHIHFNHDEGRIDTLIFKLGSNRDLLDQYWDNANHCGLGRVRGETGTTLTNYSISSDSAIFEYQNASYGTKRFKLSWSSAKGLEMEMVFNLSVASSVDEGATWEPGGDNDGNDYIKVRKADLTETTFHYTYPGPSTGIWDGQALGTGTWDADYDEVFGYKYSPALRTTFSNGLSADGPFHYLSSGTYTLKFAVKKVSDFWTWLGN